MVMDSDIEALENAMLRLKQSMLSYRAWERTARLAHVTIDQTEAKILRALYADTAATPRLQDIAKDLGLEAPTITRKVQQLEAADLVTRYPDDKDGRAFRIQATSAGRAMSERLRTVARSDLASILKSWQVAERHQLIQLLDKLASDAATMNTEPATTSSHSDTNVT
jgi:DNA-binding MarR family transcriptional regulator